MSDEIEEKRVANWELQFYNIVAPYMDEVESNALIEIKPFKSMDFIIYVAKPSTPFSTDRLQQAFLHGGVSIQDIGMMCVDYLMDVIKDWKIGMNYSATPPAFSRETLENFSPTFNINLARQIMNDPRMA